MEKCRTLIAIPAFNEEETIGDVIKKVEEFGTVLILNDGSTDNTKRIAQERNCKVISHKSNKGYDKAFHTIFNYFSNSKFDLLITIDADGQHPTKKVLEIINFYSVNYFDLYICERKKFNRLSEYIFSYLSKNIVGTKDPLSGMKGYSRNYVRDFLNTGRSFDLGIGPCIFAKKTGRVIECSGIDVFSRVGKSRVGSKMNIAKKLYNIYKKIRLDIA